MCLSRVFIVVRRATMRLTYLNFDLKLQQYIPSSEGFIIIIIVIVLANSIEQITIYSVVWIEKNKDGSSNI
jgi:hypothetical protein